MTSSSDYWRKLLKLDEPIPEDLFVGLERDNKILGNILYAGFNALAKMFFRVETLGLENIPRDRPFILASNHLSALDYPFLVHGLPQEIKDHLYVIGKKYLFDRPLLKFFVRLGGHTFAVDNEGDFIPALRTAVAVLRFGKSIYIAPEGTRSFDGKLGEFRPGVGVLAVEANVPIVPAVLKGTYEILDRNSYLPKLHQVKIIFGKPVEPAQYIAKKDSEMAYYVYKEMTDELKARMLELQDKL